jgi:hypothetical protein
VSDTLPPEHPGLPFDSRMLNQPLAPPCRFQGGAGSGGVRPRGHKVRAAQARARSEPLRTGRTRGLAAREYLAQVALWFW